MAEVLVTCSDIRSRPDWKFRYGNNGLADSRCLPSVHGCQTAMPCMHDKRPQAALLQRWYCLPAVAAYLPPQSSKTSLNGAKVNRQKGGLRTFACEKRTVGTRRYLHWLLSSKDSARKPPDGNRQLFGRSTKASGILIAAIRSKDLKPPKALVTIDGIGTFGVCLCNSIGHQL